MMNLIQFWMGLDLPFQVAFIVAIGASIYILLNADNEIYDYEDTEE